MSALFLVSFILYCLMRGWEAPAGCCCTRRGRVGGRTVWSVQGRVGVGQELLELLGEPVTGDRRVGQGTTHVVAVTRVALIGRITHTVETLALVVVDLLAGAVGLTRRLHPHIGIDTRLRSSGGTPPPPRTGLVAPVTGLDALVVAAPIDTGIHIIPRTGPRRPVRTTPTIAGGVDEHADPLVK